MDATDAEYLRKWDRLISLEAAASGGGLRDTWHRPAAQVRVPEIRPTPADQR